LTGSKGQLKRWLERMTSLTCRHQPSRQRASRVRAAGYRPEINQKWKSPALFILYIIPLDHFPLCHSDFTDLKQ